jgi:hypothetical protein
LRVFFENSQASAARRLRLTFPTPFVDKSKNY